MKSILYLARANRNDALEFANRTFKNLRYLEAAHDRGEDVHIVTQLANSLLGLVVFPWERNFVSHIESLTLAELSDRGWPKWKISLSTCSTLGELTRHVRNAVAHGRITYWSDSRSDMRVALTITDCRSKNSAPYWRASIQAAGLRQFCEKFIELIDNTIG
jgi:hypothetical protein